jgi:hypothetical protein
MTDTSTAFKVETIISPQTGKAGMPALVALVM